MPSHDCHIVLEPYLQTLFHDLQSPDDLFETISQALMNAVDRDAVSGWGGIVHIM